MRQAAKSKSKGRGSIVGATSIPAPCGGWNARDSLAQMKATDAVILENWFPTTTELQLRYGYSNWATGLPSQVESLLTYAGGATSKMFAVSNGGCYDVSSGGAVGAAKWSGKSNSRWQYCNITTAGGSYLIAANAADAPYSFDGATWANPAITGVTTTNLDNPIVHKSRLWFTEKNTLKTWYLPTLSIAGAANAIDMSAVAQLGGYIVNHATWTIDAGTGVDDYYVAVTNQGEVIVYQGTDPSDSTKWALKGVWRLGAPVGTRCLYKYAGDLLLISQDGLVPFSGALQSSRVNPRVALTDKIQYATSEAISKYGSTFGWEVLYYPKANQLWLNVPVSVGSQQQYVMNTISQSWCKYKGWNANCFELWDDEPYFGGNGVVCKAWDTYQDNGANIQASALQAFSNFGTQQVKRFTATKPVFRATGTPAISSSVNVDFDIYTNPVPLSFAASSAGLWGSGTWGSSLWGGDLNVLQSLQSANAVGTYGAVQMKSAASNIDLRWISTGVIYEQGYLV